MALLDDAYALITTQGRSTGTIIPDVVIEEHHFDKLSIVASGNPPPDATTSLA